jgi:hypothetical protein
MKKHHLTDLELMFCHCADLDAEYPDAVLYGPALITGPEQKNSPWKGLQGFIT